MKVYRHAWLIISQITPGDIFSYPWKYVPANASLSNNLIENWFNFIFTECIHNAAINLSGVRRDDKEKNIKIIKLWSNFYTDCGWKHIGNLIHLLCVYGQCTKCASIHGTMRHWHRVVITTHCSATGDGKSRQLLFIGCFIDRGQITHAP